jgi:hypothetical protein
MWKMLAGILQLSAIEWVDEHSATGDAVAVVANPAVSQQATENLGLGALPTLRGDVKTALNMIPAGRKKSMSAMKLDAKAARNQTLALIKDIYHHLFMWTVAQVDMKVRSAYFSALTHALSHTRTTHMRALPTRAHARAHTRTRSLPNNNAL